MIELYRHQAMAVACCAKHERWGFWWDCGTGKTHAMLAMVNCSKINLMPIRYRQEALHPDNHGAVYIPYEGCDSGTQANGGYRSDLLGVKSDRGLPTYHRTLVLCPKQIMRNAWEADAEAWPDVSLDVVWRDSAAKRRKAIADSTADIMVLNYDNFEGHIQDFLGAGITRLICDESSFLKTPTAKRSKAAMRLAKEMESVYLLSGTPAPNGPHEYWSQMGIIDIGLLGASFYRFAGEYCTEIKRPVRGTMRTVGYRENPLVAAELRKKLATKSWVLSKDDALDLPEQVDVVRNVELTDEQAEAYRLCEDELRDVAGNRIKSEAVLIKMRQVLAGGMYVDGKWCHSPYATKMDHLMATTEEISGKQMIIWGEFRGEIKCTTDAINYLYGSDSIAALYGETKGDVRAIVDDFQHGNIQYLVCHPQSVGHGLTLTAASYAYYLSLPWSWEFYKQSRDRIHRAGQRNPCTYFVPLATIDGEQTVDHSVLRSLQSKRTRSDAILDAISGSTNDVRKTVSG